MKEGLNHPSGKLHGGISHSIGRELCVLKCLGVGSHAFLGRQNHFEHSIKVPLIFKGPVLPKNHVVQSKVYLYDNLPKLSEYLGIEIPDPVNGESYLGYFTENKEHRRTMYYPLVPRSGR